MYVGCMRYDSDGFGLSLSFLYIICVFMSYFNILIFSLLCFVYIRVLMGAMLEQFLRCVFFC